MDKLLIRGGRRLNGTVTISGAKNAALPDLCAALLSAEPMVLNNVPRLQDVSTMLKLLRNMGCGAEWVEGQSNSVRLELTKDLLRVSSQNPDMGEASEEIPVDYSGPDLKIGFNARYVMDALSAITADPVQLEFNDELSPGILRPADDLSYTCVVMPMRI